MILIVAVKDEKTIEYIVPSQKYVAFGCLQLRTTSLQQILHVGKEKSYEWVDTDRYR